MSNLFTRFKRLLGTAPTRRGEVTAVVGTDLVVEEEGGGVSRIQGSATVGQWVYFRDHLMDSVAPSLPTVLVEE